MASPTKRKRRTRVGERADSGRLNRLLEHLSQRLNHRPVATMFEEALRIRNADRMQSFTDKLHECLLAASTRFSQIALELAEGLLYGIEVRRIGRQVDELASPPFDQFFNPLPLVGAQVVHHHYLTPLKRGAQNILQVGLENRPVGRTLHHQRRSHTHPLADGREQRYVLAPVAGNFLVRPLTFSCPSVKGCQRCVRRTLIPLTRTQRPFFRPKPICRTVRERVDSLTVTPATFCR